MIIPDQIVLATENAGKASELQAILSEMLDRSLRVLTLRDFVSTASMPDEVGESFCEIAALKAEYASRISGLTAIGDDSGLCVDALDGAPGIRSRRWIDTDDDDVRNSSLIALVDNAAGSRTASFVSCLALSSPAAPTVTALGECPGTITRSPRGANGFGYDPIFEVADSGLTMAELSKQEKNLVSHRARALKNLLVKLDWIQG